MRKLFFLIDNLDRRIRLIISLVIGIAIFFISKNYTGYEVSFLLSWIGFAVTVLFFAWITILAVHPKEVGIIADEQDSSRLVNFIFIVAASVISLSAIILLLKNMPNFSNKRFNYYIILSAAAVLFSWLLIHTVFAIRYAHIYYCYENANDKIKGLHAGGLDFPGDPQPNFLDFAYFSFVLGMTFQVSDVTIKSRHIRKLALLHGFLSFVYNTVIVSLSINIISGIIAK